MAGPAACPIPLTEAQAPTARPRLSPSNSQVSSPITAGANAAASKPPRQRQATSSCSEGAVAAPTAHTAVPINATQYTRRRPNRSPIQPTSGIVAVNVSRNPTTTKTPLLSGASNSSRMAGSGTLTTLLLTVPTNVPASRAASASGVPSPCGRPAAPGR